MRDRLATNAEIRAKEVRLIGPEGKQIGIVPLKIAIEAAQAVDLDLVEVSPDANPPVAKVMDYGKFLFEQERAARDARKSQRSGGQKALRFRPKIDDHDYETKKRQARKFLEEGHSVRVQVMFRARELRRPEMGQRILDHLADDLSDLANVESRSGMEGRFVTMVLGPKSGRGKPSVDGARREPAEQAASAEQAAPAEPAAPAELAATEEPAEAAEPAATAEPAEPTP